MREQVGSAPFERTQPVPDRFAMAPEPFVLANRPPHDEGVNRAEFGAKLRGIEPTVIAHPSTEDGPYPVGYILQLQVVAPMRQRRTLCRILVAALLLTAGRKLTKRLPPRFCADRGLNV